MIRVLIWGTDDLFPQLAPHYFHYAQQGLMSIVGFGVYTGGGVAILKDLNGTKLEGNPTFERVILSTKNNFYDRMKQLEGMGIPRNIIIDGSIFSIQGFEPRTFFEKGTVISKWSHEKVFYDATYSIYARVYNNPHFNVNIDVKSSMGVSNIDGGGNIEIGKFTQISWHETFEMGLAGAHKYTNSGHNYRSVAIYDPVHHNWSKPKPPVPDDQKKPCRIVIGNDVWIGRGCFFKVGDPDRPLIIGDGAVIASDSVVVKSVEPYTIVGGNPARFIKYRFDDPKVIERLQRIRWWDWSLDKIHDNYKYFDDPRAFVERFDQ